MTVSEWKRLFSVLMKEKLLEYKKISEFYQTSIKMIRILPPDISISETMRSDDGNFFSYPIFCGK